ncbi:semaphorin-5B [Copidosoma floridanum]|uniref:semaphorin-5B n=1 Tax=Copidosoma floridanum TaxID=29053 RepID=UPI0006C97A23|nr:semaphorin-5B [Copidosoma floridanum]
MLLLIGFTLLLQVSRALSDPGKDYRHISYDDLAGKTVFQQEGVATYSQLLFDVSRQQVIVGARDNLYCLTLSSLTPLEHAVWPASEKKISQCQNKGQTAEACRNYIKVLLSNGKRIFACGTYAFSPLCSWREIDNINNSTSTQSGVAMCPYSPYSNVTALLVRGPSGGLFAGTPTEFSGSDAAIYRTTVLPNLRTRQYDSKWLNEPQFVGSFETEDYIYFLFRESAVEYINCGKRVYSRIARVCKYDPGSTMLMKDTWTTFSKARLNCSLPGEFPFYYDEIQGAVYEPEQGVVYATFTTPSNAIAGSAICAFNMSAILAAFDGPFKHQENSGAAWERKTVARDGQQQCGPGSEATSGYSSNRISDNQLYQLMDEAVQGVTRKPLHTVILERFTHLAVDVTATKSDKAVAVLYVATSEGLVKKISLLPEATEACVVEVWGPLPAAPITMQYLKETKSLYVGMQHALLRIPTLQCHRHLTAQSCLDAQDPYCGWDEHLLKCSGPPAESSSSGSSLGLWRQEVNRCPELEVPRPGGWGVWGPGFSCPHGPEASAEAGHCVCQTRACDNPPPRNGGPDCPGSPVRVANCTQHGGWSAWSAWSSCGQSCGPAIKTRRRTCTNPAPAHGGRVCLGSEHEERFCVELPPCPLPAQPTPRSWSNWGPWSTCSRLCNGGTRTRTRSCEPQPTAAHGDASSTQECTGCNFQVEECNKQSCPEIKKSYTSAWLQTTSGAGGNSSAAGHSERRYRFTCRAQADEPTSVKVQTKVEERYCRADGFCSRKAIGGAQTASSSGPPTSATEDPWADWSSWSGCSQSCGGGTQYRIRQCRSASCEAQGLQTENRACNSQPCEQQHHHHYRGGILQRDSVEPAGGISNLPTDYSENDVNALPARIESSSVSFAAAATSCFAAFVTGLLLTALGIYYYLRRRKEPIPSSPHYISRQNPYVTVPLKEINTKRQPSFSGSINGTLRKNNAMINGYGSPKLYPKALEYESATLKRNSREQHLRAELDQEKYY